MDGLSDLTKRERDKLQRMDEAFDRLERTLVDVGRQGLQRLSRPVIDQLQGAETVAHNAGLVKVERELAALATQARRYLERDPVFRAAAWLASVNRAWELIRAAREAWGPEVHPDALTPVTGSARRTYGDVGRALELQAVGASGWVTESGFVGITVWLYDTDHGGLFVASTARPVAYFGDDPRRLLYGELSEHHTQSLLDLAHGAWVFHGAKASADRRLSLHQELGIEPGPWLGATAYRDLHAPDWLAVVDRLRDDAVDGVGRDLVYVEPTDVSRLVIDDKRAVARCRLSDGNGAWMSVHLLVDRPNNPTIDALSRLTGERELRPDGWFGRVWVADGELRFHPYTALFHEPMVLELRGRREVHALHLGLEPVGKLRRP